MKYEFEAKRDVVLSCNGKDLPSFNAIVFEETHPFLQEGNVQDFVIGSMSFIKTLPLHSFDLEMYNAGVIDDARTGMTMEKTYNWTVKTSIANYYLDDVQIMQTVQAEGSFGCSFIAKQLIIARPD